MSWPKLLQSVEIGANNDRLGYTLGGAQTATMDQAAYDTIIEALINLKAKLVAVSATFNTDVDYRGIVTIANTVAWVINWATTDDGLEDLLGFSGAEAVVDVGGGGAGPFVLTATSRHLYGWYSPVGVEYPGIRRRISRRVQETDAGGASIIASSTVHQYIDLLFDACLEGHLDPIAAHAAGAIDDGYGGTIDWEDRDYTTWWEDVAAKEFRYYEDASMGTVAAPGTEGVAFLECVRLDQELVFDQVDASGYTYFSVRLPVKVV
jgi:hypothetical protein